jgi:hypothetical protein
MKVKIMLGTAIFVVALVGASGWATPATHAYVLQAQQDTPQPKTASGQVAAVTENFVTLNVKTDNGDPQTLEFSTDSNTKIEGKLVTGVTATVEYRTDQSGKNTATRIVVQAER